MVVTFKSFKVDGPGGVSVAPILSFVSAKVFTSGVVFPTGLLFHVAASSGWGNLMTATDAGFPQGFIVRLTLFLLYITFLIMT